MERPRTLVPYLRVALVSHRRRLLAVAIVIALAVVCAKGWRLYSLAQALRADARALEAAAKPDASALASLGQLLAKSHFDALALYAEAAPLFPITRRLGWVPVYGPDVAAAEPLLDLVVGLSGAADDSFAAFAPLILARDRTQPLDVALTARLT